MMKKKLLTFALTATMVISSVFSAFAVELKDEISGNLTVTTFFNEKTDAVELKSGDSYEFTFNDKSNGTAWYNNYVMAVTGAIGDAYTGADQEILIIRADNFGWGGGMSDIGTDDNPLTFDTNVNWDLWAAAVQSENGLDTTVTIARDGDTLTYVSEMGDYYFRTTTTSGITLPETCYVFFTGEACVLSGITTTKLTSASDGSEDATTEEPTEDNEEPTTVPSSNTDNPEDESSTPAGSEDETTAGSEDETTAGSEEEPTVTPGSTVDGEEAGGIQDAADPVKDADGNEYTLKVTAVTEDVLEAVAKALEAIDELKDATYVVLDLKIEDADGVVITATGEYVVTIPVPAALLDAKAEWVKVLRLEDDGTLKTIDTVEVKDGKITFTTDHFSTYVFVAVDAPKSDASVGDNQQTGDKAPIVPIMVLGAIAVGAVVAVSAKKREA